MDSRFYKKENVKYNLYPQSTKIINILSKIFINNRKYKNIKDKLDFIISDIFSTNKNNIYYFSSASKSLEKYLRVISAEKNIRNVYIPSYSCMEIADAIIKSNLNLKVYDIQENLIPSIETLQEIAKDLKAILILPSLFGKNTYSSETLKLLSEISIPIIIDEAQSFPNISRELYSALNKCAVLISFGKTKPISAIGGGGIIDKDLLNDKSKMFYEINTKNYIKNIFMEIKVRLKNKIYKYTNGSFNKYKSLEELVFDKINIEKNINEITKLQIIMAYYRIKKYKKLYNRRNVNYTKKMNIFGSKKLSDYNYIPLSVNNEYRYSIMQKFGANGLQTTLYYYPIHLIPFYKDKYKLDKCPITEKIFSRIIILPFGIDYRNRELRDILKIINNEMEK